MVALLVCCFIVLRCFLQPLALQFRVQFRNKTDAGEA